MFKLLKLAHWEDVPVGKWLVEAGKKVDRLRVIFSGKARVEAQALTGERSAIIRKALTLRSVST